MENDTDVTEMAKRMSNCTVADGCVYLGTVQIKHIQALVWWVWDNMRHGQALNAADFTPDVMEAAMENKHVKKEQSATEVSIKDLPKFQPGDFDVHKDAFLNLLAQTYGAYAVSI